MTGGSVPGGSTLLRSHFWPSLFLVKSTPPTTIIFGTAGGLPSEGYAKSCGYSSTGCQTVNINRRRYNTGTYRIVGTISRRCNRLDRLVTSFTAFKYARSLRELAYQQPNIYTFVKQQFKLPTPYVTYQTSVFILCQARD